MSIIILTCNTCHKTWTQPPQMSSDARERRTSENYMWSETYVIDFVDDKFKKIYRNGCLDGQEELNSRFLSNFQQTCLRAFGVSTFSPLNIIFSYLVFLWKLRFLHSLFDLKSEVEGIHNSSVAYWTLENII